MSLGQLKTTNYVGITQIYGTQPLSDDKWQDIKRCQVLVCNIDDGLLDSYGKGPRSIRRVEC